MSQLSEQVFVIHTVGISEADADYLVESHGIINECSSIEHSCGKVTVGMVIIGTSIHDAKAAGFCINHRKEIEAMIEQYSVRVKQ